MLTPDDYGLYGKVLAIVTLMIVIRNMGFGAATVQRSEINQQQVSNLFWISATIGLLIASATVCVAPLLADFYEDKRVVGVTHGLAVSLFLGALQIQHLAILHRQMRFNAVAVVEIVGSLVGILAAIGLALNGGGYWALVLMHVTTQFVSVVTVVCITGWFPGLPRQWAETWPLICFGGNLMGFKLQQYVAANTSNVLLGKFVNDAALGNFTRAYQLLMLPMRLVFTPLGTVAVSMLSRVKGDGDDRLRKVYLQLLDRVAFATIPVIAFLISTSDWIVAIALGPQWSETVLLFLILGYGVIFGPVSDTSDWLFVATGKTRQLFRFGFLHMTFTVTGTVVGLIGWGVEGVAWGIALSSLLCRIPLKLILTTYFTPVSAFDMIRTVAPACLLGACFVAGIKVMRVTVDPTMHPVLGVAAAGLCCLLTGAIVFLLVRPVRRSILGILRMRHKLLSRSEA